MESLTDQNFLRGLATLFVFIGFIGICIWAYLPSRKEELRNAANLPFSDEQSHKEVTDSSTKQTTGVENE